MDANGLANSVANGYPYMDTNCVANGVANGNTNTDADGFANFHNNVDLDINGDAYSKPYCQPDAIKHAGRKSSNQSGDRNTYGWGDGATKHNPS